MTTREHVSREEKAYEGNQDMLEGKVISASFPRQSKEKKKRGNLSATRDNIDGRRIFAIRACDRRVPVEKGRGKGGGKGDGNWLGETRVCTRADTLSNICTL